MLAALYFVMLYRNSRTSGELYAAMSSCLTTVLPSGEMVNVFGMAAGQLG